MPTFDNIEIDFEVFCGTCGAGLCNESDTRSSHGRRHPQVVVNACPNCMKNKDYEIKDLKDEIADLNVQIYHLEEELRNSLRNSQER